MNFLNRCNGLSSNASNFSHDTVVALKALMPELRAEFLEWASTTNGSYHAGIRFTSDEAVIDRIESGASEGLGGRDVVSEEEVVKNARAWVLDALRDCAGADHWYTFEKRWD